MSPMLRRHLTCSLGAFGISALAACGTSDPPPAPAAPSRPVPIDGSYNGILQLTRGDAINCGNQDPVVLQVADRSFTYQLRQPRADWAPVLVFRATIQPDGSFNAQAGS